MTTERQTTRDELVDRARAAYDAQRWGAAADDFVAADREAPLGLDDLERLGYASHLVGRSDVAAQTGIRGFTVAAESGEIERAALIGFWTGMTFAFRGDDAQAGAWFARATEVIEKSERDVVAAGYLLIPVGLEQQSRGDDEAALATYEQISAIAERFHDPDLATFGRLGRGESLKNYYEKQSSGRYSVAGTVTDWVKVQFNEARYGRSNGFPCDDIVCDNTWELVKDGMNAWVESQEAICAGLIAGAALVGIGDVLVRVFVLS